MALILASTSPVRAAMLDAADIAYRAMRPSVDEAQIKARLKDPAAIAVRLAEAKALSVGSASWSVGSDSIVSVDGRLFDKPRDRDEAARHLQTFSGRPMQLTSAVALARRSKIEWRHVETATLQVRPLSDAFIDAYLDAEWPDVGYCVGVFRLEGRGAQLFERIEGDYFAILGMPLVPLLGALRERGLLDA